MHLYISTYLHNLSLQFAAYLPTYNAKTSIFVCSDGGTSLERERERERETERERGWKIDVN